MRTSSPSPTWVPSAAGAPLTVTRPLSIHLSASRREQAPVSLMNLLSLKQVPARRPDSRSEQKSADLLRQDLRSRVQEILGIAGGVRELRVGKDALHSLRSVGIEFVPQHEALVTDGGSLLQCGNRDEHQASDEFRPRVAERNRHFGAVAKAEHVNLAQAQVVCEIRNCRGSVRGRRRWWGIRFARTRQIGRIHGTLNRDLRQKARKGAA